MLPPAGVQGLPFGQLSSLWDVLVAWGAPSTLSGPLLLTVLRTVVGCGLELCSGGVVRGSGGRGASPWR